MSGFGHRVYKNYDPRAKVSAFFVRDLVFVLGFGLAELVQVSCSLKGHEFGLSGGPKS